MGHILHIASDTVKYFWSKSFCKASLIRYTGIGLEVHEAPYLRGGSDAIIQTGHTFSDEPGIYIEGEVGVRLEDCFFISDDGSPTLLTQGVGGRSMSPWEP